MPVPRHNSQGLGRLAAVPGTASDVARDRQPPQRREHRQRGHALGTGPPMCRCCPCRYVIVNTALFRPSGDTVRRPGTRLGVSEHPDDNRNAFRFRLHKQDKDDIEAVLARSNGRRLITLIGDCGAEYR